MRFITVGNFEINSNRMPRYEVDELINDLGGKVYEKKAFQTLIYRHSRTPHCFVVLKNDELLSRGTMNEAERRARFPESETDVDNDDDVSNEYKQQKKLEPAAKTCREFAGAAGITFISVDYIFDSRDSDSIIDPYLEKYKLLPGSSVRKIYRYVNDIRPLMQKQINGGLQSGTSSSAALRHYRRKECLQGKENETQ